LRGNDGSVRTAISGQRYYNPGTGRWLSRDPSGENGSANLYSFTENNSVNRIDPNGMVSVTQGSDGNWDVTGTGWSGSIGADGGSASGSFTPLSANIAIGAYSLHGSQKVTITTLSVSKQDCHPASSLPITSSSNVSIIWSPLPPTIEFTKNVSLGSASKYGLKVSAQPYVVFTVYDAQAKITSIGRVWGGCSCSEVKNEATISGEFTANNALMLGAALAPAVFGVEGAIVNAGQLVFQ